MKREIKLGEFMSLEPVSKIDSVKQDLAGWLRLNAEKIRSKPEEKVFLLAHLDDGVVWGRVEGDKLSTSNEIAPETSPPLRATTLQQCRLFSESGEIMIWKDGEDLRARLLLDGKGEPVDTLDEDQILWGTNGESPDRGFTMVYEGQGMRHAVPIFVESGIFDQGKTNPLRLQVRHYIRYDETGCATIFLSRLVRVFFV